MANIPYVNLCDRFLMVLKGQLQLNLEKSENQSGLA